MGIGILTGGDCMEWHDRTFAELSAMELYSFEKLRIDTFVVEQGHEYHDLDEHDLHAHHIFLMDGTHQKALAYARVFPEDGHITFGRVATALSVRGQGYGAQLIDTVLAVCAASWPGIDIVINAQVPVIGFYEKKGFAAFGDVFSIENTPHRRMFIKAATRG
ncbi:acetyltransferase [Bifidobacterium aquikefiri]|uniref:Acetyltransferase n=2 Tax=Bifidobacterium aquikefiri TaxID=1653207 RepID=A0A261G2B0_9BIFI|nr:acetyltransferase [Bifidobacterium aquikefiri]